MGCGGLHGEGNGLRGLDGLCDGVGLHSKGKAWEGNGVGQQSHGTA